MMNDSKKERIELHLHTTVSDDISVITPKEVIETAVKQGHKAVAITNLNSVQDFAELEACQQKYGKDIKVIYGLLVRYRMDVAPGHLDFDYGITLLAKNTEGIKALYRILSTKGEDDLVDWQTIQ